MTTRRRYKADFARGLNLGTASIVISGRVLLALTMMLSALAPK
jgi:hypothetical protein